MNSEQLTKQQAIKEMRTATAGQYRVVTADGMGTFDWVEGEFDTYDDAVLHVNDRCVTGCFYKTWVYDDKGECLYTGEPI